MKTEFIANTLNRAAGPIFMVLATAILSRTLPHDQFLAFLLAVTISQWGLQFFYLWIKNSILKTLYYQNFVNVVFVAFLCSTNLLIFFVASFVDSWELALSLFFYTFTGGLFYVASTISRQRGYVAFPQFLEVVANLVRWPLGIIAVKSFDSLPLLFSTMGFVNAAFLIVFLFLRYTPVNRSGRISIRDVGKLSIWLFVVDASSSTMMYVDRWISNDSNLIIHSTIGNQFVSVLVGAISGMYIHRVSRSFNSNPAKAMDSFAAHYKTLIIVSSICIACAALLAPLATYILSPNASSSRVDVALYALSQSLHLIFMYLSIMLLMVGKNYVAASVYGSIAIIYVVFCYNFEFDWVTTYPLLRAGLVFIACMTLHIYIFHYNKNNWRR